VKSNCYYTISKKFPPPPKQNTAAEATNYHGDKIGRISAYWAIVYFGHFLKITGVALIFKQPFNELIAL
jgi:cytochrome b subunit of formate dehydrogenase